MELRIASGRFAVQFRGDGYNHFSCHSYPAHSHWSLSGDELTINWGQYGTYVMKFTSETTAEGSLKGKPADWRRMKYVRDLDARSRPRRRAATTTTTTSE